MDVQQQNSTKKIIYVITKGSWGGASRYVFDLAVASKARGYQPMVVCGGGGALVEKLEAENIETVSLEKLGRDVKLSDDFAVYKALKLIFESAKPDIVHLNSSKIGGIGALAAKQAKVPKIIFTAHGWAFNEDRNFLWCWFAYIASYMTVLLAHTTITISYKEEQQALSFPLISSNRIQMIYNGIGGSEFLDKQTARQTLQATHNLPVSEKTIWIGSLGELHDNKGHRYALDMCSMLKEQNKDFVYFIIGEGERRKELQNMILEKKLEKNVALVGAIPTPITGATLLKAFDIFVFPSTKEGLPYAVLEAGLAHVPVLATDIGGIPEIIEHQKNGLVAPSKSGEALAYHIEHIFYDNRIREDYALALHRKVLESFSIEQSITHTFREYER